MANYEILCMKCFKNERYDNSGLCFECSMADSETMCTKCQQNEMYDNSGLCLDCSMISCPLCGKYKPQEAQMCGMCLWGSDPEDDYTMDDLVVLEGGSNDAKTCSLGEEEMEEALQLEDVAMCYACRRNLAIDKFSRCMECWNKNPKTCRHAPHEKNFQMCASCARQEEDPEKLCSRCETNVVVDGLDLCEFCNSDMYVCRYCKGPKKLYNQTCRECLFNWALGYQ
jgi:hypothetical protein